MHLVVGTGPGSISAAYALAESGQEVLIIEPGNTLEPKRQDIKAKLAAKEPHEWTPEELVDYRGGVKATTKGIPQKLIYGSDYIYQVPRSIPDVTLRSAKITRSFADGGLSNIWGACLLPYPEDELIDWPIPYSELADGYRGVMEFIYRSGADDELSTRLPMFSDSYDRLPMSRQASRFLADLHAHREKMRALKIAYGVSRLAVKNKEDSEEACRSCGLCLYGCPYDLIYSTAYTLRNDLLKRPNVRYLSGYTVEKLTENGTEVTVQCRSVHSPSERAEHVAKKVYVGAGIIETARIMLESYEAYDHQLQLQHSDRFTLPFVRFFGTEKVTEEQLNTLCQLFLEIRDSALSDYDVHLQTYTYNDLFKQALENKQGVLAPLLRYPTEMILSRLLVFFGYIHSKDSSHLNLRLLRDGEKRTIEVEGVPNARAKKIMHGIQKLFLKNLHIFKGIPGFGTMDLPGGGNHTGGSFPMCHDPQEFQCDSLGRPRGFRNVHLVDASTFPSLPAATITYSIMANSFRIAKGSVV